MDVDGKTQAPLRVRRRSRRGRWMIALAVVTGLTAAVAVPVVARAAAGPPSATVEKWRSVAVGDTHACGVSAAKELYCWGLGSGRGLGGVVLQKRPVRVGTGTDWESVVAGNGATCGLRGGGKLYCWGANQYGRLGLGANAGETVAEPKRVGSSTWRSVALSYWTTCGVTADDKLYCWGDNRTGGVGTGKADQDAHPSPARVGKDAWSRVTSAAATVGGGWGSYFCGIRNDKLGYCWGRPGGGATVPAPAKVGDQTWLDLAVYGGVSTCGISTSRSLYCWGDNSDGQLGTGDRVSRTSPTRIGGSDWQQIVASGSYSAAYFCGLESDPGAPNRRYCWGEGEFGSLGLGKTDDVTRPTRRGGDAWKLLAAGGWSGTTCGITAEGKLYCWGLNKAGTRPEEKGQGMLGIGSNAHVVTTAQQVKTVWTRPASQLELPLT